MPFIGGGGRGHRHRTSLKKKQEICKAPISKLGSGEGSIGEIRDFTLTTSTQRFIEREEKGRKEGPLHAVHQRKFGTIKDVNNRFLR